MEYLLIPLACFLAAAKILIQSKFAKDKSRTPVDAIFFNGIIFLTGAVFLWLVLDVQITAAALLAGLIIGAVNLSYQLFYVSAFACGPISLTTLISSVSMVVPIVFSAIVYHEPLNVSRALGILATIASLYFSTVQLGKNKFHLKWILFTALAFLANCTSTILMKVYLKSFAVGDSSSFVAVHFTSSAILSLLLYLILTGRGKRCTYPIGKAVVFTGVSIGVILGCFNLIYAYAMSVLDATLLLPLYNGATTLLVTLGSALLMKERLNRRQYIGVLLGIIAIVLMSL